MNFLMIRKDYLVRMVCRLINPNSQSIVTEQ